jgi:hypothetical protein
MSGGVHDRLPDAAYLHRTDTLQYGSTLGRHDAWQHLTGRVRRELKARVGGRVIDWVAGQADESGDRVWAAVLGPAALQVASPGSDKQTWTYSGWRFEPGSLTTVTPAITGDAQDPPETDPAEGDEPLLAQSLDDQFRAFLGHLPASLQVLIQQPFRPGPDFTAFRWYYGNVEAPRATWSFWCYLADNVTVTFAAGSRKPSRRSDTGFAWDMRCHQAAVTQVDPA